MELVKMISTDSRKNREFKKLNKHHGLMSRKK
jgi:hypothetical protein